MKERIHIVFGTDENFIIHLSVAICSVLKNAAQDAALNFYILHEGLSEPAQNIIRNLQKIRNFDLQFIFIDCSNYKKLLLKWGNSLPGVIFARFKVPEILHELKKCIYLDVDIIVRADISELWAVDISRYLFGAVEEPKDTRLRRNIVLNISCDDPYFNTGILLLNLDRLRTINIDDKVNAFLKTNTMALLYPEQDILNKMFHDKCYPLPMQWNVITGMYTDRASDNFVHYDNEGSLMALRDPAIVHFTGKEKPDSFLCLHPYAKEYWDYLKLTPSAGLVLLKNKSFKNFVVKFFNGIRLYLRHLPFISQLRQTRKAS